MEDLSLCRILFYFQDKITSINYKFMTFYVLTTSYNEEAENHFKLRNYLFGQNIPLCSTK